MTEDPAINEGEATSTPTDNKKRRRDQEEALGTSAQVTTFREIHGDLAPITLKDDLTRYHAEHPFVQKALRGPKRKPDNHKKDHNPTFS
jgi:hypothetical protein